MRSRLNSTTPIIRHEGVELPNKAYSLSFKLREAVLLRLDLLLDLHIRYWRLVNFSPLPPCLTTESTVKTVLLLPARAQLARQGTLWTTMLPMVSMVLTIAVSHNVYFISWQSDSRRASSAKEDCGPKATYDHRPAAKKERDAGEHLCGFRCSHKLILCKPSYAQDLGTGEVRNSFDSVSKFLHVHEGYAWSLRFPLTMPGICGRLFRFHPLLPMSKSIPKCPARCAATATLHMAIFNGLF